MVGTVDIAKKQDIQNYRKKQLEVELEGLYKGLTPEYLHVQNVKQNNRTAIRRGVILQCKYIKIILSLQTFNLFTL